MKILVDGDACPVKDIIVKVAKEFKIDVVIFIDTSHIYSDDYSVVVTVDKGADSVDIALINKTQPGDIVVTQDYGLATMVLSKKGYAINNHGLIYTNENIDALLMQRYIGQKLRKSGVKTHNPRKRTSEDNSKFEAQFRYLCAKAIK
ncbi:hypothetical protein Q428_01840 [Fervidicella metallireducens AeB]|uniref:UPF0178 protein Q428_01840 n=1 Tax=Fervidicella metallireducens AeB TaxID=1403537 RepID=A0A017RXT4_9CLOT|nr:YaiI/YqxD family protein [Fervidicella metallireducens]EYE89548.1 hypothetical protein Q428_01840 [Fervidicella metallireducens AeB]